MSAVAALNFVFPGSYRLALDFVSILLIVTALLRHASSARSPIVEELGESGSNC
jgi:hypothetical protein